jgi:hypothetical protein
MHRLVFLTALAIFLANAQAMACQNGECANGALAPADCNSIGCARPINATENLTKTANACCSYREATSPASPTSTKSGASLS